MTTRQWHKPVEQGVLIVLSLILGGAAFFNFFGTVWFADELSGVLIRGAVTLVGGAFVVGLLPPLVWPHSSRLLSLVFAVPFVFFAALTFPSMFGPDGSGPFLFWSSCTLVVVGSGLAAHWLGRCLGRHRIGLCLRCGYDLRATHSVVCPECGSAISRGGVGMHRNGGSR